RQRPEQAVQRAKQAHGGARNPLGAALAHGARPDPDQHVPREQQDADRGQEHLPAAAKPVRERQRDKDRRRYLGADLDQGQQGAVARELVIVDPGHGGLRARGPARDEDQRGRGYQQPPGGRHNPGPSWPSRRGAGPAPPPAAPARQAPATPASAPTSPVPLPEPPVPTPARGGGPGPPA